MDPDRLTIGVVANLSRPSALSLLIRVRKWAATNSVSLLLIDTGYGFPPGNEQRVQATDLAGLCDVVLALGGDGTLLKAAPLVAPYGIALVAVNTGRFGFLATAEGEEVGDLLDELLAGELKEEKRSLLRAQCPISGISAMALNDVVVHRAEAARVVDFETKVGGALLSRFSGDGVCVSTPTGSTAYSLSAGGAVLHPSVEAIVITPLCAHTLAMRSMVVSDKEQIELAVLSKDAKVHVFVDGQVLGVLGRGERVVIERAEYMVRLLQRKERPFYRVLREKLGWAAPKFS